MKKEILLGAMLLLPLVAVAADFAPLAIKPGLWEATITTKMHLPDAMLSDLSPDQRVQMEAMMAGRGAPARVSKSCVTKEGLSRGINFGADARKTCQFKLVSSSATRQELAIECTSDGKSMTGKATFEALSPESGRAVMQMSQGGDTKMEITVNSRYLGPDCGDVKPR